MAGEGDHITGGDLYAVSFVTWTIFYDVLSVVNCTKVWSFSFELHSWVFISLQTVFENSLMEHHVALPPDAMGKVTFVASPGQYSLKVSLWLLYLLFRFPFLGPSLSTWQLQDNGTHFCMKIWNIKKTWFTIFLLLGISISWIHASVRHNTMPIKKRGGLN